MEEEFFSSYISKFLVIESPDRNWIQIRIRTDLQCRIRIPNETNTGCNLLAVLASGKLLIPRMFPLHVVVETLPANTLLPTDLQIKWVLKEKGQPQKIFNIYRICKTYLKSFKLLTFLILSEISEKKIPVSNKQEKTAAILCPRFCRCRVPYRTL